MVGVALVSGPACNALFGVDELCFDCGGSTTSAGGAGAGSQGGGGTGGTVGPCQPGTTRPCYDGLPGTEGVGPCRGGIETCGDDGETWSGCQGEVIPQTEDCHSEQDEDCNGYGCGETVWSLVFGDGADEEARRVVVDEFGRAIVGGAFGGSMVVGSGTIGPAEGQYDPFLLAVLPDGVPLEGRAFAGLGRNALEGLALDGEGNILIAGGNSGTLDFGFGPLVASGGDGYIAKLDPLGQPLWSVAFGGNGTDEAQDVGVLPGGDVIVAGYFDNSANFAGTVLTGAANDAVLARLDGTSGVPVWVHSHGSAGSQIPIDLAVGGDGNSVVCGYFENTLSFGGANLVSAGNSDVFVVKLDGNGAEIWSHRYGGAGDQRAFRVATDSQNSVVLVGSFAHDITFGVDTLTATANRTGFVAKLSSAGAPQWSMAFGEGDQALGLGVAIDGQDNLWLSGVFEGTVDFGGGALSGTAGQPNLFVAKLAPDGSHLHSRAFAIVDYPGSAPFNFWNFWNDIAVDSAGFAVVTGYFHTEIDFAPAEHLSSGGADIFVAKLAP